MAKHEDKSGKGWDDPDKKFGEKYSGKHTDDNKSFDPTEGKSTRPPGHPDGWGSDRSKPD